MKKPSTFVLFSLFLFSLLPLSSASPRRSYGELCNKTVNVKCDRRAGLSCGPEGNCDCVRPEEMIYVKSLGKCVTRAGEACKFALEINSGSGRKGNDQDELIPVYRYEDCVPSAYCASNGFCSCNETTHFETLNGTCDPLRNYSESCDSVAKCYEKKGLICGEEEGRCQCSKQAAEAESQSNSSFPCVGLAGEACINSICTQDALCFSSASASASTSSSKKKSVSSDTPGVCICKDGFYQTEDGKCLIKLGHHLACNKTEQCGPAVTECIDSLCTCDPTLSIYGQARRTRYPDRAKDWPYDGFEDSYYTTRSQCLGLSGHPCIDGYCSKGAYCDYVYGNRASDIRNFTGTCKCQNSNYPCRKTGLCKLGYQGACKLTNECVEGLVCRRKKCECPFPGQTFGVGFQARSYNSPSLCSSKVRGPCRADAECQDTVMECVSGNANDNGNENGDGEATWTLTYNKTRVQIVPGDWRAGAGSGVASGGGHCFCKAGFVENVNRTCDLRHGQNCDDNSMKQCDTIAGLVCVNNVCSCGEFDDFNEELRRCEGLVGASCQLDQKTNGKCPSETETGNQNRNGYGYGNTGEKKKSPCGKNMDCVSWFPGHPLIHVDDGGYCTCQSGFSETTNYTCEPNNQMLNDFNFAFGNSTSGEIQIVTGQNDTDVESM